MFKAFVATLSLICMLLNLCMAADYTVGGAGESGGWSDSSDIETWASPLTFFVGDNLIFRYTLNHDVTEVSEADFDSCTTTSPLQPPFTGGSTIIPLTRPGVRYFICQTSGHCITGMKLQVNTRSPAATPPIATPTATPPPAASPPSNSTNMTPRSSPPPSKSVSPTISPTSKQTPGSPKVSPRSGSPVLPPVAPPPLSSSLLPPPPSTANVNVIAGLVILFAPVLTMIANI